MRWLACICVLVNVHVKFQNPNRWPRTDDTNFCADDFLSCWVELCHRIVRNQTWLSATKALTIGPGNLKALSKWLDAMIVGAVNIRTNPVFLLYHILDPIPSMLNPVLGIQKAKDIHRIIESFWLYKPEKKSLMKNQEFCWTLKER
jgi:hypothetical protein